MIVITLLYNLVFLAVFHRTEEFAYLWNAVTVRIPIFDKIFGEKARKGDMDE